LREKSQLKDPVINPKSRLMARGKETRENQNLMQKSFSMKKVEPIKKVEDRLINRGNIT